MYWPNNEDSPLEFGPLKVSLTEERQDSVTPSVIVRDFSVVHSNKVQTSLVSSQYLFSPAFISSSVKLGEH